MGSRGLEEGMTALDIDSPCELADADIASFRKNGFVRLKNVLAPDVLSFYGDQITRKVFDLNTLHLPMEERTTYQKAFLQVMNIWQHDETVRRFVFGQRLARIATSLLGVQGMRMYHDQALYKEAGGGFTPWHADQFYWPLDTDNTVTVWVPLQATPHEMGPLNFSARSHRHAVGRNLPISDDSE